MFGGRNDPMEGNKVNASLIDLKLAASRCVGDCAAERQGIAVKFYGIAGILWLGWCGVSRQKRHRGDGACRALRPLGASSALGPLFTLGALLALRPLRPLGASSALGPLFTLGALLTLRSLRSLGASLTLRALRTLRALFSLKTLLSLRTFRTLRTLLTLGTLRTFGSFRSLDALRSLGPYCTRDSSRSLGTHWPLGSSGTRRAKYAGVMTRRGRQVTGFTAGCMRTGLSAIV